MPLITTRANASARGFGFEISTATADTGAMFPLQVVTVGAAGASSVSFTNIPATYSHLQVKSLAKTTNATDVSGEIEFNNNAGTRTHEIFASGSGNPAAYSDPGKIYLQRLVGTNVSDTFTVWIIDILDYANTNKNTVTRTIGGYDANGSGVIALTSGLWNNTEAVNSIKIKPSTGNFSQYSQFALYGIRGA